ncbi:cytochrome P450 [Streptomyces odontomachi]|uniref:cytochrome P450 n=1 Tax=Streptomyces odontomachi TaxID=2944940 RepID=UPI00210AB16B|nr:cytochrome P450 [Streptomyces sp. ODS25]
MTTDATAIPETADAPAFPMARTCPHLLPDGYAELRDGPVLRKVALFDGPAWIVTRHAEARALLGDNRLSAEKQHKGFPAYTPPERMPRPFKTLAEMDPPEHTVHRRMLIPAFAVRRIQEMRPFIQETVNGLIDAMEKGGPSADLVKDFAVHVPSMVICDVLDIPYEDREIFQRLSYRITQERTTLDDQQLKQALGEIFGYLGKVVEQQIKEPGPGLMGVLATERVAKGELEPRDMITLALVLLVAAQETTASTIANGTVCLLENPEQLAKLQADPDLWNNAIEEILRITSVSDLNTRRVAAADIEIAGEVIRAGEGVIIPNGLVNRDATVFDDPDVLDVTRSAKHHLAFGHGVHNCIGQSLARVELEIAFKTLFTRLPSLRLTADVADLPMSDSAGVQALTSLPIAWDPKEDVL